MTSRVAIFLPSLAGGGAERVSIALAGSFVQKGLDCDIVLVDAKGELLHKVPADVRVVDLGASKPIRSIPSLISYLRRENPTALLSSLPLANIAALIASKGLGQYRGRVVTRIATREDLYFGLNGNSEPRLDRILRRHLYKRADATIAISRNIREWLVKEGLTHEDRTQVIHNPLLASPTSIERVHAAPKPLDPTILACGRLVQQKDYPTLIRAFSRVYANRRCTLSILGDGPLRPSLEKLACDLGVRNAVCFHGFVEDPLPYMHNADVFVHAALFEGFGNVLLEALAAGCKVVATDGAGAAREVLGDGRFAVMVPVGNDSAMAEGIESILDGRVTLPNPGPHLDQFDINRIADQYLGVLLETSPSSQQ